MNASGGVPAKTSSAVGPQHVRRERVRDREHVAVEVHRRLGSAGRAGREGEQRDVVGGGVDVVEVAGLVAGAAASGRRRRRRTATTRTPGVRGGQVVEEAVVAQREVDRGDLGDVGELAGAQQRHRGDHDRRPP